MLHWIPLQWVWVPNPPTRSLSLKSTGAGEDGMNWESTLKHTHYHINTGLSRGNLLYDTGSSSLLLYDSLEGWDRVRGGREVQKGEDVCVPMADAPVSLVAQVVKNPPTMRETWVRFLAWEDPLVDSTQPLPVFLPGKSPWMEEPDGLQSLGVQRVGHDWVTKNSTWLIRVDI